MSALNFEIASFQLKVLSCFLLNTDALFALIHLKQRFGKYPSKIHATLSFPSATLAIFSALVKIFCVKAINAGSWHTLHLRGHSMGCVSDLWGRLFLDIELACVSAGACLIQEIKELSLPVVCGVRGFFSDWFGFF